MLLGKDVGQADDLPLYFHEQSVKHDQINLDSPDGIPFHII